MASNEKKCFQCKNEILAGKYYGFWKILKDEWDTMPDNEKEQHHVGDFCSSCWENKKPEINKVLPDYEQHIKDGYLTVRERESKIKMVLKNEKNECLIAPNARRF